MSGGGEERFGLPSDAAGFVIFPREDDGAFNVQLVFPEGVSGEQLTEGDVPEHLALALQAIQSVMDDGGGS